MWVVLTDSYFILSKWNQRCSYKRNGPTAAGLTIKFESCYFNFSYWLKLFDPEYLG